MDLDIYYCYRKLWLQYHAFATFHRDCLREDKPVALDIQTCRNNLTHHDQKELCDKVGCGGRGVDYDVDNLCGIQLQH